MATQEEVVVVTWGPPGGPKPGTWTAGGGCTWLKPEDYDEVLGNALDLLVLPAY